MNNLDRIFNESGDFKAYFHGYLDYLTDVLKALDAAEAERFVLMLDTARALGKTVFLAGNGGSAATATHMANDFGTDTLKYSKGKAAFRVLSLTDNAAVMLAVANDDGYENVFINQLRVHYRPGDFLIGVSASGNSLNVIKAARWVKANGGKVLGFVGFDGGELKRLADAVVHVRSNNGEYGIVEDAHMVMDHLMASWFQRKFLNEDMIPAV
ncbi:MAG: SIS domain-containing protein [Candidatus Omnitrophica bacterium]|nr:SIS domain-containing protein [Candidatus Omnitrophota bacterium]